MSEGIIKDYLAQLNGAAASAKEFEIFANGAAGAAQDLHSASKLASAGMGFLKDLGAGLAGVAVDMAVNFAVQKLDEWIRRDEIAIQKAQQLEQEYQRTQATYQQNVTALQGLGDEFSTLAAGVDTYGNNISLTADEYSRYQEIIQQVAAISPSLVLGYDAENQAIVNKNQLLERAIELQKEQSKAEQEKKTSLPNLVTSLEGNLGEYNQTLGSQKNLVSEDGTIFGGVEHTNLSNSLYKAFNINDRTDGFSAADMASQIMNSLGVEDIPAELGKYINDYDGSLESTTFFRDYATKIAGNINQITADLEQAGASGVGLDEGDFQQKLENLRSNAVIYEDIVKQSDNAKEAIQGTFIEIAQASDGYSELSNEQSILVSNMLSKFSMSDITSENWLGEEYVDESKVALVKSQIEGIVAEISNNTDVQQAFNQLLTLDPSSMSAAGYQKQVDALIREIAHSAGMDSEEDIATLKIGLGFDDASYEDQLQQVREKLGKEFQGNEELLTGDALKIACEIESEGPLSWDELLAKINQAKRDARDLNQVFSDLQKPLTDIGSAQSLFSQGLSEISSQGSLSADTLSSLLSVDQEYLRCLEDSDGKLSLNADKFQEITDKKMQAAQESVNAELAESIWSAALNGSTEAADANIARLMVLSDQYDSTSSALARWREAQQRPDNGDLFSEGQRAFSSFKQAIGEGNFGTNEYLSGIDLLIPQAEIDKAAAANDRSYTDYMEHMESLFGENADVMTGWNLLKEAGLTTGEGEDIQLKIGVNTKQLADALDTTEAGSKMWTDLAKQKGFEIDLPVEGILNASDALNKFIEKKKEINEADEGAADISDSKSLSDYQTQRAAEIESAQEYINTLKDMPEDQLVKLGIEVEEENGVTKLFMGEGEDRIELEADTNFEDLEAQLVQLQENANGTPLFSMDDAAEEAQSAIGSLVEKQQELAYWQQQAEAGPLTEQQVAKYAEVESEVNALIQQISLLPPEVLTTYNLQVNDNGELEYLNPENGQTVTITAETNDEQAQAAMAALAAKQNEIAEPKQFSIAANTGLAIASMASAQAVKNQLVRDDSFTITQYTRYINLGNGNGGKATAGGTGISGVPETGSVLVGEEAPEMYVSRRSGRWKLVGMMGAEFIHAEKGDIIFNARQTRSLMSNGFAASRGKAFAKGSDPFLDFAGRYSSKTDWSGWSETGPHSLGGTVTLTPKVEDKDVYLADIDEMYEAETRLKDLENRGDRLEHNLKMTDSLMEQVQLLRQINENYKQQQDELHAANNQRDDLIKKNVEKLRGAGFNVYFDPEQNKLMVANMEHLNELMGGSQEETNNVRKEYEKLISETEKLNEANQKSSAEWLKNAEAIRKNNLEIVNSTLDRYDEFIGYADDFDLWNNMDTTKLDVLRDQMEYLNRAFAQGLLSAQEFKEKSRDIGKDIYKEQKDALKDILDLTQDLIKQENKDRVAGLKKQVEIYDEIIDKKKKALQDEADEKDYSKDRDKKLKEIAKLQAQIDRLSLDDSREAMYERMSLEEELAEKQEELTEFQEDHAREVQIDALDEESKRFKEAQDDKIEAIEAEIDTEEKLYQAAMDRINAGGDQLKEDLLKYTREHKDAIDGPDSVTSAWKTATEAIQKYGSYAEAINGVKTENIGGAAGKSISEYAQDMYDNSIRWHTASAEERKVLERENEDTADNIRELLDAGTTLEKDKSGAWYLRDKNGKRLLYDMLHTGGVVGGDMDIKQNEVFALLEKGEAVLDQTKQNALYEVVDFAKVMYERFGATLSPAAGSYTPGTLPPLYDGSLREIPVSGGSVFSPSIHVEFNHSGGMKDSDAVKYGNIIANTALDSLKDMFTKSGVSGGRFSALKQ